MEPFNIIINGVLLLFFLKIFFKSILKLDSSSVLLLSVFCPTLLSIMGVSVFKTGIYILLTAICGMVILVYNSKVRRIAVREKSLFYMLILIFFILIFILNALSSEAIGYSYYNEKLLFTFLFIFLPVFLFSISFNNTQNYPSNIIKFFIFCAVLCSMELIYNAYLFGFQNLLQANFFPRLTASQEINPIWTGRFISIGFILNIIFTKHNLLKFILAIIYSFAMILTGSKSVLIFTIISIFIYFNFIESKKSFRDKMKKLGVMCLIVGFISVILLSLNPLALERRFSTNSGTIDERQGRIGTVLSAFIDNGNYLFGNGLGSVTYPLSYGYENRDYPHNVNIEMLYEFGIIGVITYNLIIFFPVALALLRRDRSKLVNAYITLVLLFYLYSQTSGDLVTNTLSFIFGSYLIYLLLNNPLYETSLSK